VTRRETGPKTPAGTRPGSRSPARTAGVNPQTFEGEPSTTEVIADRRNELSGNISLNQELRFVEQVNEWIDAGRLPAGEFVRTDIRRIEMGKRFHCSTKVDRDPEFLDELRDLGARRAREFLEAREGS